MDQLRGETCLALDTEASSFHRYHERIGLVQLSNRTDTWLVDPLAVQDMAPLGRMLADEHVEVVVHDADYDLRLLEADVRLPGAPRVRHADRRRAAQRAGAFPAALLKKYFGVVLDKRYQKADWCKRPLTPACSSTRPWTRATGSPCATGWRSSFTSATAGRGRKRSSGCSPRCLSTRKRPPNPGSSASRGQGPEAEGAGRAARALHLARSGGRAVGPGTVHGPGQRRHDDLAKEPPTGQGDLAKRKGIGDSTVKKNGAAILQAVERGIELPRTSGPA